jgi:hypothetical protein
MHAALEPARKDDICTMTRRSRDQTFRKTDVVRAIKAARAAGIANPRITIDSSTGRITIAAGAPTDDDQTLNEWDEVCDSDPHKAQVR